MRRRRQAVTLFLLLCIAAAAGSVAGVSTKRAPAQAGGSMVYLPRAADAPASKRPGSDRGRIINGTKAAALSNASRWRSISFVLSYDDGAVGICGGTFVTPRRLVTAAHCVREYGVTSPPGNLFVTSGRSNVADIMAALRAGTRPSNIASLIPVRAVHTHPAYDERSAANDAAVLEASRDATLQPTPLAGPAEPGAWGGGQGRALAGDAGPWIAGWGDTVYGYQQRMSEDLMEAGVPILSDAGCADLIGRQYLPASMICAGTVDTDPAYETSNGVDTCQGDSGGPLLAPVADGSMRLVGITSGGYGCADYTPGVYTRIDAVRPWIESVTGPASGTTTMPAPQPAPAPTQPVAGGGGGSLAITAPATGIRVGQRGATNFTWTAPAGVTVAQVTLSQNGRQFGAVPVPAGASSVLVGHALFRTGATVACVAASGATSSCVIVRKGTELRAGISSAAYRSGRMTLRGTVASSSRIVRVTVRVAGGGRSVTTRAKRYSVPAYPRGKRFSVTVPWRGKPPKTITTTTTVKSGGTTRPFRTVLR